MNVDQCWFRLVDHPLQSCSGWFRAIFFDFPRNNMEIEHIYEPPRNLFVWWNKKITSYRPWVGMVELDYLSESRSTVTLRQKLGKHVGLNSSKRHHPMGFRTKSHPLKHGSFMNLRWPQQQVQNSQPSTEVWRTKWLPGKVLRLLDIYSLGFQTPCVWMYLDPKKTYP